MMGVRGWGFSRFGWYDTKMDLATPPPGFSYILFERVNPEANENRFYYISFQPTLVDSGAVVILYGRKGEGQRVRLKAFDSLALAWPTIRRAIRTRLRRGYRVVAPAEFCH